MAWPKGRPHPSKGKPKQDAAVRVRPKDVRDMNRAELEAYAGEIGLQKRALLLTDDRLRQNIQAFLAEMFEDA